MSTENANQPALTCELNGIKYVLVEIPALNKPITEWIRDIGKKYDCITQSMTPVNGGLFGKTFIMVKLLVPEKKIIAFNNERINNRHE